MFRYVCGTLLALVLSGCVSAQRIGVSQTLVDRPSLNETAGVDLGGMVLEKARYKVFDALISSNDIVYGTGPLGVTITIPAGVLLAEQRDSNSVYYFSNRTIARDPLLGEVPGWRSVAAIGIRNGDVHTARGVTLPWGESFSLDSPPMLQMTQVSVFDATGFRQQIVYGGRSGDTLRFQYRESSGSATQSPVNQDIEWNLSDGMIVAFRGARIQIVDATNAHLVYQVISSFADAAALP